MIIGIDASNIRAGGGLTHLSCLLRAGCFGEGYAAKKVVVWGGGGTLSRISPRKDLDLVHVPMLDGPLPVRMAWQRWVLPVALKYMGCDVLFSPGGILPSTLPVPAVLMSQNLLPFDSDEADRFSPFSFMRLKMRLIGNQQRRSMGQAEGVVFLTHYACNRVLTQLRRKPANFSVIPHGIEKRFFCSPRPIAGVSDDRLFRLLYVSIVDVYKHQWMVAEAVSAIRKKGVPVKIDFVGPAYPPALRRLKEVMERLDPSGEFLHYRGVIPFDTLHSAYLNSDAFVFASSCENMPNILLEAMAAGLPIACSSCGPMPEILKDSGVYFHPEQPEEIEAALMKLWTQPTYRRHLAGRAFISASEYSWERCALETFDFIEHVVRSCTTK